MNSGQDLSWRVLATDASGDHRELLLHATALVASNPKGCSPPLDLGASSDSSDPACSVLFESQSQ